MGSWKARRVLSALALHGPFAAGCRAWSDLYVYEESPFVGLADLRS
jgi:hypothetical protein